MLALTQQRSINLHACFLCGRPFKCAGELPKLQRHLEPETLCKQTNPSEMPRWLHSLCVFLM